MNNYRKNPEFTKILKQNSLDVAKKYLGNANMICKILFSHMMRVLDLIWLETQLKYIKEIMKNYYIKYHKD